MPIPMTTPPSTCPVAPRGLRTRPDSWTAATSSTRTTPVRRSTLQRTAWVMNVGPTQDSIPIRPVQPDASTLGVGGSGPEPRPISSLSPAAFAARS